MSTPNPGSVATAAPPKPVDVDAIEKELARLWHTERTGEGEDPHGVTRVCMSNLIIFCSDRATLPTLSTEIGEIVKQHPARALLLVGESGRAESSIEAHVSVYTHTVGSSRQVCSELVSMVATGDATRRLPSAVRALLIGDLPTSLWWASTTPPPMGGELFEELSAMSGQVIFESLGWLEPVKYMVAVADWAARDPGDQRIADLSWRRLKPWRRIISQGLDPTVVPGAQESITSVYMEHGPHGLPQAWLLVSWLVRRLGWQPTRGKVQPGVEITWNFQSTKNPVQVAIRRLAKGDPVVSRMSITWSSEGGPVTAHFALAPSRLIVSWDDMMIPPRTLAAPPQGHAELVAKQLPDQGNDMLFRNTLEVCKHMAEALL